MSNVTRQTDMNTGVPFVERKGRDGVVRRWEQAHFDQMVEQLRTMEREGRGETPEADGIRWHIGGAVTGQSASGMPREVQFAIGRIFRLASRPTQPGDAEQFEACRRLILDAYEATHGGAPTPDYAPNYARDRWAGAQGDVK